MIRRSPDARVVWLGVLWAAGAAGVFAGGCARPESAAGVGGPGAGEAAGVRAHMLDERTHLPGAPGSETCPVCRIYEDHRAAVVRVRTEGGLGSGVVISAQGHAITNAHVVGDASRVAMETQQGTLVPARVVRKDAGLDLALLKAEPNDVRWGWSPWDHAAPPRVGSTVYIIGHPAGLGWTVTEGLISATRRAGEVGKSEAIQTNAAISPGNSGGPMFDGRGRLVGIVSSKLVGTGIENVGFAIPWSAVREFIAREPLGE